MENDDRIYEVLADILIEMKGMRSEVNTLTQEQKETNKRLDSLEKQQANTNLAVSELRHSVMRLGDELKAVFDHERRLDALELKVFGNE